MPLDYVEEKISPCCLLFYQSQKQTRYQISKYLLLVSNVLSCAADEPVLRMAKESMEEIGNTEAVWVALIVKPAEEAGFTLKETVVGLEGDATNDGAIM